MIQLIYASRATVHVNRIELRAITDESSRNNRRLGVTGALICCDGWFMQLLEGDEATVKALYEKIVDDPRHTDVLLIRAATVTQRIFGDWGMSCLHKESALPADQRRMERLMALIQAQAGLGKLAREAVGVLSELQKAIAAETSAEAA
jgi:hypothetical protein